MVQQLVACDTFAEFFAFVSVCLAHFLARRVSFISTFEVGQLATFVTP